MKTLTIVAIAIFAVACSAEPEDHGPPHDVSVPTRHFVERLVPRFEGLALQRIHSHSVRAAMSEFVAAEAERPWNARLDGGIKYADLLEQIYGSEEWTLYFASPAGLSRRGESTVTRLSAAGEDALDPSPYHLDRIAALHGRLAAASPPEPPTLRLTGAEAELAVQWLASNDDETAPTSERRRRLIDAIVGLGDEPPLSDRLAGLTERYRESLDADVTPVAELEARVADGALRMARDLRHFNYQRLSWSELRDRGGGKAVVYDRLEQTFAELSSADAELAGEVLVDLRPEHDQYDHLLSALEEYRGYRDAGGWEPVAPFALDRGRRGSEVRELRDRLSAEQFIEDSNDRDIVDDQLLDAVSAYQETHQFRIGDPTPGFWRSLNVPVDRRIAQLELTLARYRESNYRGEADFVFVNIPDFHAEVWRKGERRLRFRVVVGNSDRVCDPETNTWRYPNATPVQWAMLEHIMLNPWWNVPSRIFREEIAEHVDDAEWLAEKNYEIWEDEDGDLRARQRPGSDNALGLVKFIFPNEHSTYMHDTPQKQYFDYAVRAFSHGCVRVQDPLEFAAYLMSEYDKGGRERLDRIMELGSTIKIEFDEEIPVFFEYYTVRVDDAGRVNFLADPYKIYKRLLAEDPTEVPACTVVDPIPAAQDVEDGPDVTVPDDVSTDVGP